MAKPTSAELKKMSREASAYLEQRDAERIRRGNLTIEEQADKEHERWVKASTRPTGLTFDCPSCSKQSELRLFAEVYPSCDCCGSGASELSTSLYCSNCLREVYEYREDL